MKHFVINVCVCITDTAPSTVAVTIFLDKP